MVRQLKEYGKPQIWEYGTVREVTLSNPLLLGQAVPIPLPPVEPGGGPGCGSISRAQPCS